MIDDREGVLAFPFIESLPHLSSPMDFRRCNPRVLKKLLDEKNMPSTDNQQNSVIGRFRDPRQVHKNFEIPIIPKMCEPIRTRVFVLKSNTGIP